MITEPRILTAYEWPPVPLSGYWMAWDDNLGVDTSPIGTGQSEQEAIDDLKAQLE
jgi:hypothetical protein